jgi:hypothetical protein
VVAVLDKAKKTKKRVFSPQVTMQRNVARTETTTAKRARDDRAYEIAVLNEE